MRLVSTFVVLMVGCLAAAAGCSDGSREDAVSAEEAALSSFTFAGPTVVPVEEELFGAWDGEDGRVLTLETSRLFKLESPCADAGPCAAPITGRWSGVLERGSLSGGNRKALLFGAQYVPSDTIGTIDRLNDPNGGLHWFWFRQDATTGASSLVGSTSLPAGGTVGRFTKRPPPAPPPSR